MAHLTREEVHAGIDRLVGKGLSSARVSVQLIRNELGNRGSLSTISTHRKSREAAIANPPPSVDESVRAILNAMLPSHPIVVELQSSFDNVQARISEVDAPTIDKWRDGASRLTEDFAALTSRLSAVEKDLAAKNRRIEALELQAEIADNHRIDLGRRYTQDKIMKTLSDRQ